MLALLLVLIVNFAFTVEGNEVAFLDTSDGVNIVSWEWDFGDGTTSTEQNPTHSYEEAGSYQVKLTITDSNDYSDTVTKFVNIAQGEGEYDEGGGGGTFPPVIIPPLEEEEVLLTPDVVYYMPLLIILIGTMLCVGLEGKAIKVAGLTVIVIGSILFFGGWM